MIPRLRAVRPLSEMTAVETADAIPHMTTAELAQLPDVWMDPLVVRLWHRDPPRTSQLRAAQGLGEEGTLIVGGKRSGKTAIGLLLCAMMLRGPDDQAVRLVAEVNGLDVGLLRRGPVKVCMATLGWDLARDVQRSRIPALLPHGTRYAAWNSKETAHAYLPNGNVLLSKSYDQGPLRWQSDEWDLAWLDEQPPEEIWAEVQARLLSRAGRWVVTMWPPGRTHLHDSYIDQVDPRVRVHHLDTRDSPFVRRDPSRLAVGSDDSALTGRIVSRKGLVYPEWDRDRHMRTGLTLDPDWPRYWTLDPGTSSSHWVLLRVALDERRDVLHVYREYRGGMHPLAWHVEQVTRDVVCPVCWEGTWSEADPGTWRGPGCEACGGTGLREPAPEYVTRDPTEAAVGLELESRFGWPVVASCRDVEVGMDRLRARLTSGRVLVHAECQADVQGDVEGWSLVREMERFAWRAKPGPGGRARVVKHFDHAPDALRHLVGWLDDPERGTAEAMDHYEPPADHPLLAVRL